MKRLFLLCMIAAAACASVDEWDAVRVANRTKLLQLHPGMTREDVLRAMGTESVKVHSPNDVMTTINNPFRTEFYQATEHKFELLYYYTDLKKADGAVTDDELTPLVLKDGILDGWGWSYLNAVSAKYEIRLR